MGVETESSQKPGDAEPFLRPLASISDSRQVRSLYDGAQKPRHTVNRNVLFQSFRKWFRNGGWGGSEIWDCELILDDILQNGTWLPKQVSRSSSFNFKNH